MESSPEYLKQTVYPEGYPPEVETIMEIMRRNELPEPERVEQTHEYKQSNELFEKRVMLLDGLISEEEYEEAHDRSLELFTEEQAKQIEDIADMTYEYFA